MLNINVITQKLMSKTEERKRIFVTRYLLTSAYLLTLRISITDNFFQRWSLDVYTSPLIRMCVAIADALPKICSIFFLHSHFRYILKQSNANYIGVACGRNSQEKTSLNYHYV